MMLLARGGADGWFVFGLVVGAACLSATAYFAREVRKRAGARRTLTEAGAAFGGTVTPGSMWTNPVLHLSVDGVPGVVSYYEGERGRSGETHNAFTRMHFRYTGAPETLRVFPEGFWGGVRKLFGAQDIQVGDAGFDRGFLIQGSSEIWARDILDADVRWRLASGRSLDVGPAGVTLITHGDLSEDVEALKSFMGDTVEILRRIRRGGKIAGVLFLEPPKAEAGAPAAVSVQGLCPVCGGPMDSPVRRCRKCATPHHGDCWKYFGGCAIYACGSRR